MYDFRGQITVKNVDSLSDFWPKKEKEYRKN